MRSYEYALGANGSEYTINPTNGAATFVGTTGGSQFFLDMVVIPTVTDVPEIDPASTTSAVALLAMGVTLLNTRRKRAAVSTKIV